MGSSQRGLDCSAPNVTLFLKVFDLGGAILDPQDVIEDVLDDNDFVSIVLETDRPNPNLAEAEVRFVPSQIPGGKFEMPDVYLSLDGCSLAVDDLG